MDCDDDRSTVSSACSVSARCSKIRFRATNKEEINIKFLFPVRRKKMERIEFNFSFSWRTRSFPFPSEFQKATVRRATFSFFFFFFRYDCRSTRFGLKIIPVRPVSRCRLYNATNQRLGTVAYCIAEYFPWPLKGFEMPRTAKGLESSSTTRCLNKRLNL